MEIATIKPYLEILNCITDWIEQVELLNQFACKVTELVISAIGKINVLKVDEVELRQKFKECEQKLVYVQSKSEDYSRSIKKLLKFAKLDVSETERKKNSF